MQPGSAFGVGVSEIFLDKGAGGIVPPPGPTIYVQQDFSPFAQQDGSFYESNN